jgi:CubicO group peptidase (beta-lactamase class C family)
MKLGFSKPAALLATMILINFAWAAEMPPTEPEEVGLSSERLERFSTEMEKGVDAGHFSGAVAAVARNTIFRLASMTKAITGVAVMILYEEGHFTLNDPVSKFIPSFKNARVQVGGVPVPGKADKSKDKKDWSQADLDRWLKENWDTLSDEEKQKWTEYYAAKGKGKGKNSSTETSEDVKTVPVDRPITIRDLLRHTAGISYAMGDIWAEGDDLGQMIDKLAAQPLKSQALNMVCRWTCWLAWLRWYQGSRLMSSSRNESSTLWR